MKEESVPLYRNRNWCYEKYILEGLSHQEMADLCGASKRVIEKWCSTIFGYNNRSFALLKKLSPEQKSLIMFGALGDGHITNKKYKPIYIESHAANEKDYLYWKYGILKDICLHPPKEYAPKKEYSGVPIKSPQRSYRLHTRVVNELGNIRDMSKTDIISQLDEFGLSIHILDDGHRARSNWELCLAALDAEEIDLYCRILQEKLGLYGYQKKDNRYIVFDAVSSRNIDQMILENVPNDLDIVQRKIIQNDIADPAHIIWIETNHQKIGLARYCRRNHLPYLKCKRMFDDYGILTINEKEFYEKVAKEIV